MGVGVVGEGVGEEIWRSITFASTGLYSAPQITLLAWQPVWLAFDLLLALLLALLFALLLACLCSVQCAACCFGLLPDSVASQSPPPTGTLSPSGLSMHLQPPQAVWANPRAIG